MVVVMFRLGTQRRDEWDWSLDDLLHTVHCTARVLSVPGTAKENGERVLRSHHQASFDPRVGLSPGPVGNTSLMTFAVVAFSGVKTSVY